MRRFLNTKLFPLAVILVVVTLLAGIAGAAAPGATGPVANPQAANPQATIILEQFVVLEGQPALSVLGSGFAAKEVVLVEIIQGGEKPNIAVGGGLANAAGAFDISTTKLSVAITKGVYTVQAKGTAGSLATTPLKVVVEKIAP